MDTCQSLLRFGGLGHTCVIYSKDDARIRQYAERMPAFRVLVNTPAPQGSTGITTNVFPSMTLGCGAVAGNITSDNVGPQHLINIKRLAYVVRKPEEAFTVPVEDAGAVSAGAAGPVDRSMIASAVERYLKARGIAVAGGGAAASPGSAPSAPAPAAAPVAKAVIGNVAAAVVDRFLAGRGATPRPAPPATCGVKSESNPVCHSCSASAPAPPAAEKPAEVPIVDFVCEDDVRSAMKQSKKIYIGPKTIVTPSARELAGRFDILVLAQR
jgi:acetaldehyde dehydrogenase (acetylating)